MSVVPSLFEGMAGKAQTKVLIPTTGMSDDVFTSRDPRLGLNHTHVAPPMFNSAIDYSTRDGVLPCFSQIHHVLREPPPNPMNAYQAPMGVGRNQDRGLQYTVPLNNPIMPATSSVYADRTPEPPSEPEPPPPPARETRTATRRTDRPAPSLSMDDEDDPEMMSVLQQASAPVITNVYARSLVSYTQAELEDMIGLGMDITTGPPRRVRRRGPPPAS